MAEFQADPFELALAEHFGLAPEAVIAGSFREIDAQADGTTTVAWRQVVDDRVTDCFGDVSHAILERLRRAGVEDGS